MSSRGSVSEADMRVLSAWLLRPGHREAYPHAEKALIGRHGCSAEEGRTLQRELGRARSLAAAAGGCRHADLGRWAALTQQIRHGSVDELSEDDLIRATFLGHLPLVRDRITTMVPELRANEATDRQALGIVFDWAVRGQLDVEAAIALAERRDPEASAVDVDRCDAWFAFLRPSAHARASLDNQRLSAARYAKKAERNDDRAQEIVHRERAAVGLRSQLFEGAPRPEAFRAFYIEMMDFHGATALFVVVALEMNVLNEAALAPEQALGRLRAFIREPVEPPAPVDVGDDPGIRALDVVLDVLAHDRGLTLTSEGDKVRVDAS